MVSRTLIICGLVAAIMVMAVSTVGAIAPGLLFLGSMAYNDARTSPMARPSLGINPSFTAVVPGVSPIASYRADNGWKVWEVNSQGNPIGSNPRPDTIVAAIGRGTWLLVDPGFTGRVEVQQAIATSNAVDFPEEGIRVIPRHQDLPDFVDSKLLIPVDTSGWRQGLYAIKIKGIFREYKKVWLGLGKKGYWQHDEKTIWVVVLDPGYLRQAANDPRIQAYLRYQYGLMGGPATVGGQTQYPIDPNLASALQDGSISDIAVKEAEEMERQATEEARKYAEKDSLKEKSKKDSSKPTKVKSEAQTEVRVEELKDETEALETIEDPLALKVYNGPTTFNDGDVIVLDRRTPIRVLWFEGKASTKKIQVKVVHEKTGRILLDRAQVGQKRSLEISKDRLLAGELYKVSAWAINGSKRGSIREFQIVAR